jgi:DNA-binding transcriptional LysR family regulator
MDRLTSMAVFKRAVELGSFAAAARHFGMSPKIAGNHVRALEARLGVRLLNCSTRRLHLTEAGESYYARCTQILAAIGLLADESRICGERFDGFVLTRFDGAKVNIVDGLVHT